LTFIIFFLSLFLLQWVSWLTYARGNVMDATLKAPFCHMRQPRCAARRYSAIAYEGEAAAAAGLPCATGEAAAVVTAITVQSLLAVAQRERGSF
jgi:hypothetical protein